MKCTCRPNCFGLSYITAVQTEDLHYSHYIPAIKTPFPCCFCQLTFLWEAFLKPYCDFLRTLCCFWNLSTSTSIKTFLQNSLSTVSTTAVDVNQAQTFNCFDQKKNAFNDLTFHNIPVQAHLCSLKHTHLTQILYFHSFAWIWGNLKTIQWGAMFGSILFSSCPLLD